MKFAKEQRVRLPGDTDVQAVVVDATETIPGFPIYAIKYLNSLGEPQFGTVGEGDLVEAQTDRITQKLRDITKRTAARKRKR